MHGFAGEVCGNLYSADHIFRHPLLMLSMGLRAVFQRQADGKGLGGESVHRERKLLSGNCAAKLSGANCKSYTSCITCSSAYKSCLVFLKRNMQILSQDTNTAGSQYRWSAIGDGTNMQKATTVLMNNPCSKPASFHYRWAHE